MKAAFTLLAIVAVLYAMKVISFDLPLLKRRYKQFCAWLKSVKGRINRFFDWFNNITGNGNDTPALT